MEHIILELEKYNTIIYEMCNRRELLNKKGDSLLKLLRQYISPLIECLGKGDYNAAYVNLDLCIKNLKIIPSKRNHEDIETLYKYINIVVQAIVYISINKDDPIIIHDFVFNVSLLEDVINYAISINSCVCLNILLDNELYESSHRYSYLHTAISNKCVECFHVLLNHKKFSCIKINTDLIRYIIYNNLCNLVTGLLDDDRCTVFYFGIYEFSLLVNQKDYDIDLNSLLYHNKTVLDGVMFDNLIPYLCKENLDSIIKIVTHVSFSMSISLGFTLSLERVKEIHKNIFQFLKDNDYILTMENSQHSSIQEVVNYLYEMGITEVNLSLKTTVSTDVLLRSALDFLTNNRINKLTIVSKESYTYE